MSRVGASLAWLSLAVAGCATIDTPGPVPEHLDASPADALPTPEPGVDASPDAPSASLPDAAGICGDAEVVCGTVDAAP
jgi:hypothetical protein